MSADPALVLGILLICLSVPSAVSAFADSRRPTVASVLLGFGLLSIAYARYITTEPYTIARLPNVIAGVIADLMRSLLQ